MRSTDVVLSVALMVILMARATAQATGPVLERPLTTDTTRPFVWGATQTVSSFVYRLGQAAGVPIVFEVAITDPFVPSRHIDLAEKTLRDALELLVAADPRYSWREVRGVVIIRPATAWTDPSNPLNNRVDAIAWDGVTAGTVLNRVFELMYGHPVKPDDFVVEGARSFSMAVSSGSILDVLVASARSHGAIMWSTPYNGRLAIQTGFSIGYHIFDHAEDQGRLVATELPRRPPSRNAIQTPR